MTLDLIQIARACHTANQALQHATGDPTPSPDWDDAPDSQRDSAIAGVKAALNGATPEQLHEAWGAQKIADGWVWGEEKSETARTHPCLVPYAELPPGQRAKDAVFHTIVFAFAHGHIAGQDEAIIPAEIVEDDEAERLDRASARYFAAPGDERIDAIRADVIRLASRIDQHAPAGRNKSLAFTALEDAHMRANRAIWAPAGQK